VLLGIGSVRDTRRNRFVTHESEQHLAGQIKFLVVERFGIGRTADVHQQKRIHKHS
jgi:hypothetical protein